MIVVQQIINGMMVGSAYALVALGFSLIFGVMRVLNMAHPELFMLATFSGLVVTSLLTSNFFVLLLAGMLVAAAVGLLVERLVIRPVSNGEHLTPLITTIGASLFLQNLVVRIFGPDQRYFPDLITAGQLKLGPLQISSSSLVVFVVAFVLMAALKYFVSYTKFGTAIRAVAENADVARILGVNVKGVIVITMALASALAGAAGILIGMVYHSAWPFMGINYGLKAMVITIVGGVGSIEGTVLGGLLLGVTESLTVHFLSSSFRDAVAFGVLVVVLLLRPEGLIATRTLAVSKL